MKTAVTVNGRMFVADVRKEKKGERHGAYHYVAKLVEGNKYGYGDTTEEATDDLRSEILRKPR